MRKNPARISALLIAAALAFATLGWQGNTHRAVLVDTAPFVLYVRVITQAMQGEMPLDRAAFFLTVNLAGNVAVFVPLGFCLHFSLPPSTRRLTLVTLIGAAFSTALELGQLALPGRTTAIDDVLLNTLGTAIGGALAALVVRRQEKRHERRTA